MTSKALWRAVVEVVGDVGDGEPGIFEEAGRANEARHGEIALGGRNARSKESAHQRARGNVEVTSEEPYIAETW